MFQFHYRTVTPGSLEGGGEMKAPSHESIRGIYAYFGHLFRNTS